MTNREPLESLFAAHGFTDFRWIPPGEIVISQWVRLKCMYGCSEYGRNAACPPNVPSVAECERLIGEYRTAVLLHFTASFDDRQARKAWTKQVNAGLLALERAVFLAGYHKAFLLPMDSCQVCGECASAREECHNPKAARPTPEAMAIDLFETVRRAGYPIEVLTDPLQAMNRYALLLVE